MQVNIEKEGVGVDMHGNSVTHIIADATFNYYTGEACSVRIEYSPDYFFHKNCKYVQVSYNKQQIKQFRERTGQDVHTKGAHVLFHTWTMRKSETKGNGKNAKVQQTRQNENVNNNMQPPSKVQKTTKEKV